MKQKHQNLIWLGSAIATLLCALAVYAIDVPNPNVILITAMVFFTFAGGFVPGAISGLILIAYSLFYFSEPGQMLTYTEQSFQKILVIVLFIPIMVVLVGLLQRKALDKTRQLETANRQLLWISNTDALTGIPNRRYFN